MVIANQLGFTLPILIKQTIYKFMRLLIKDRIYIPQLLQKENNFLDFTLKKSIIQKVSLSEEDVEKFNIQEDSKAGRVTWDSDKDEAEPLVVEFTQQEIDYLKRSCEALSESVYPDDLWLTVEKIYNEINGQNNK